MTTSILVSSIPGTPRYDSTLCPQKLRGRRCSSSTSCCRKPLSSSKSKGIGGKLSESRLGFGRESGLGCELGLGHNRDFPQGRRGVLLKAQKKDESGIDEGGVDDTKPPPFYAASQFWIQFAIVILTVQLIDAGYSGDWSRIGAISRETEGQLRIAAYFVVPCSIALVWAVGKRKETP